MVTLSPEPIEDYRSLQSGASAPFWTRIAIGGFVAIAAYCIMPSNIPWLWFIVMAASQAAFAWFHRRFLAPPQARLTPAIARATLIILVLASIIYTSISAYLWFCGPAGQVFATTIILGSLLHIALYRQAVPSIFVASTIAQGLFLFGLPIVCALEMHGAGLVGCVVMVLAGALYVGHLVAAVGQSHKLMASLRSASNSKSAFLATLSHEIRTPLNAVTSAAHLLGRTELTLEQQEHVSILLTGSEVLLSLINDVLDMSKIEAGKLVAEYDDVDIPQLTRKLTALWTPKAQERGLSLEMSIAPGLPDAIRTDPLRLNQILFNLLSNAVKFTAEGGIKVRVTEAPEGSSRAFSDPKTGPTFAENAQGRRLRFEVIDTGSGMSDEVQGRLFRSFEQANAGVALRHGGTGLGLAISRRLAELLGGNLNVSSAPNCGSTFVLEIPLVPVARKAGHSMNKPSTDEAQDAGRRLSILLAEDHPVNRRLVDLILRPLGWELTMVENGAEAVDAADQRAFDVILLDMQMPIMSGIEAARRIKASRGPNASTPLVALTANAFEDQRADWLAAGAAAFMTKPLNPSLLIETLMVLGESGAPASEPAMAASVA